MYNALHFFFKSLLQMHRALHALAQGRVLQTLLELRHRGAVALDEPHQTQYVLIVESLVSLVLM